MPTDLSPLAAANALVRRRRCGGIIARGGRMHSTPQGVRELANTCAAAMRPYVKLFDHLYTLFLILSTLVKVAMTAIDRCCLYEITSGKPTGKWFFVVTDEGMACQ